MGEKLTKPEADLAYDQGLRAVAAVAELLRATADQRTSAYELGRELDAWLTTWKHDHPQAG